MSGGGTQGEVGYPAYQEAFHLAILGGSGAPPPDKTFITISSEMWANNPYTGAIFTNPSNQFDHMEAAVMDFDMFVHGLGPLNDWDGFVTSVGNKLSETGILDTFDIEDIFDSSRASNRITTREAVVAALAAINDVVVRHTVRQFERRVDDARRRALNRFSGAMSDINAVQSSAFVLGLAHIEAQHIQSVDEFDAGLTSEVYRTAFTSSMETFRAEVQNRLATRLAQKQIRDQALIQNTSLLMQGLFNKADLKNAVAAIKAETVRMRYVGTREYETSKLDLDRREAEWDIDVLMKGGQLAGALGGAVYLPPTPSTASSALSGALSGAGAGAATGATIGAAGGPIGAGAGAIIGGILGLGAGLL